MTRYVIAWPGDAVKRILALDPEAIFLDDSGWWIFSPETETRSLIKLNFDASSITEDVAVADVRRQINWWSPVWTRWLGAAEEYELLRSQSVFTVLKLLSGIKSLNVSFVLMHTGVPHHWDSSILSIACEVANLKQVFLYSQVFDGYLLPLIQSGNISSRRVCNGYQIGKEYNSEIDQFIIGKMGGKSPATQSKSARWKTSYLFAFIMIFYRSLTSKKNILRNFLFSPEMDPGWVLQRDYGFFGLVNIINNQNRFIAAYTKAQLSYSQVNVFLAEKIPRLVIAAHYQPEATSFPEGGDYFSHVDIILALRLKGYKDDILYKEHPASWFYSDNTIWLTRVGLYRSDAYVADLIDLGCQLLPKNVNLSIRSDECKWYVPITITGTIALERSLVGLHTIVTGEPWFKDIPGLIHLSEITSLGSVDPRWAMPDPAVAKKAKDFLLNLLSNNTLINYPGIGSGRPSGTLEQYELFKSQILNLIKELKN